MSTVKRKTYFDWLVGLTGRLGLQYTSLLTIAYQMSFYEVVPNDSNRAVDGLDLRRDYYKETGVVPSVPTECTVLEMLIGVANRMAYMTRDPDEPSYANSWFWGLIGNLDDMMRFTDDILDEEFLLQRRATKLFENVVIRNYEWTGKGGLFPLRNPRDDQRNVEIWSQMNAWVEENYSVTN